MGLNYSNYTTAIVSIMILMSCSTNEEREISVHEKRFMSVADSLRKYKPELQSMSSYEEDTLVQDFLRLSYTRFKTKYEATDREMDMISNQVLSTCEIAKSFKEIDANMQEFEEARKELKYDRP